MWIHQRWAFHKILPVCHLSSVSGLGACLSSVGLFSSWTKLELSVSPSCISTTLPSWLLSVIFFSPCFFFGMLHEQTLCSAFQFGNGEPLLKYNRTWHVDKNLLTQKKTNALTTTHVHQGKYTLTFWHLLQSLKWQKTLQRSSARAERNCQRTVSQVSKLLMISFWRVAPVINTLKKI